jgi:uncharacterized membrane protein
MLEPITGFLKGYPNEVILVVLAALPISELRGSIPFGLMMGMAPLKTFILSVLGNSAIIIPTLFLLEPVSSRLRRFRLWRRFFDWLFEKTREKSDLIEKYEALGLMLFVAVPLPMTGAWSGCIAASLFKIKFRYAFPAIFLGVVEAGLVVMAVCLFGKGAFEFLLAK